MSLHEAQHLVLENSLSQATMMHSTQRISVSMWESVEDAEKTETIPSSHIIALKVLL